MASSPSPAFRVASALAWLACAACNGFAIGPPGDGALDADLVLDGGVPRDGGAPGSDAGRRDGGAPIDGGAPTDGGVPTDAGWRGDAGSTVAVTISPTTASLSPGGSLTFNATVVGMANTAVSWSATGGSVSGSGLSALYSAPSTAGTYTV